MPGTVLWHSCANTRCWRTARRTAELVCWQALLQTLTRKPGEPTTAPTTAETNSRSCPACALRHVQASISKPAPRLARAHSDCNPQHIRPHRRRAEQRVGHDFLLTARTHAESNTKDCAHAHEQKTNNNTEHVDNTRKTMFADNKYKCAHKHTAGRHIQTYEFALEKTAT